ncbi:uncharacterized protein [Triticum aestivum]|uniref:uncharacterized protein n=1 Tax=Triticum aestivum TaxID=4565 RepID=UPI001D01CF28|nr:uncharacterized protein LOC123158577 [Triticum aestivum]
MAEDLPRLTPQSALKMDQWKMAAATHVIKGELLCTTQYQQDWIRAVYGCDTQVSAMEILLSTSEANGWDFNLSHKYEDYRSVIPADEVLDVKYTKPSVTLSLHFVMVKMLFVDSSRHPGPVGATATRLLCAAVRLEPEEIVLSFPWGVEFQDRRNLVRLPCFQRTKSLMMERLLFYCPDGEFTALRTLSISYGLGGLHSLLPRCPHLLVLSLKFVNDGFGLVQNGSISLHLPSLQELFLESSIMYADAVDIVAPLLKRLTVSFGTYKLVSSFSVSAPMLEKVSWHSWYLGDGSIVRFGRWSLQKLWLHTGNTQGQLPSSLHISASASNSSWFTSNEDNFAQEIEKHLVADFSLLELRLLKAGHVFGALVFHLLGITRISRGIQRLKIVLERSRLKGKCSPNCSCQPTNWRSQTISLTALEEVEINGFEGQEHEFDLLKLILKCAPVLKKMILQLSREASSNNSGSTKIYDICRTYSSVDFFVYESSRLIHGGQIYPLT